MAEQRARSLLGIGIEAVAERLAARIERILHPHDEAADAVTRIAAALEADAGLSVSRGLDAYRKTWDLFFGCQRSSYAFDIEDIAITAGDDVAFAVAVMRCGAPDATFQFRLTIGLCKVDGDWFITHEHHSVPATE
ncbi:nuclear transport factor 2 family protein [Bradyrhizobium oropedii]|uniref:nuclear transport factor 2 family protein n=1 Tax=Bradyrhizobium oropedii TaxID=1571201 RepID=UPI001E458651|nr:nuclear transport factor 2 family protein [Bradyrhizobium oropedii]